MSNEERQTSWFRKVEEDPLLFNEAIEALLGSRVGSFVFVQTPHFHKDYEVNGFYLEPETEHNVLGRIMRVENSITVQKDGDYFVSGKLEVIIKVLRFDNGASIESNVNREDLDSPYELLQFIQMLEDNELDDGSGGQVEFVTEDQLLLVRKFVENVPLGIETFFRDMTSDIQTQPLKQE